MRRFILFVLVVALCVYGLYRWTELRNANEYPEQFTPAAGPRLTGKDVDILQAMEDEYTRLVQAVVPSVVSITATRRVEAPTVEDPFELFFGRRFAVPRQTEEMHSLGSGVIVSEEGHIVTNQHVIADVDEVRVKLSNGQEAPARIIGADPVTDIAVLQVTGLKVTPLAFVPDSDQVKVGQRVIAVGNPFGYDETVTQGIISAKGRAMEDSANDFFQTDAAINPGNSGGPLVDLHGEIIGINASIYTGQAGGWQGLGFAIPANTARRALEAIIKTGRVPHGYLGVNVLSPELLARMGLPQIEGAYVNEVVPGSPADGAGIQKGDIVTAIGQHPIHSFAELRAQVANVPSGTNVPISIQRGNQTLTLTARITDQPDNANAGNTAPAQPQPQQTPQPSATQPPQSGLLAGVHVFEIPADHEADLPPNAHGVMVSDVDPGSPAADALQQSDVIEEIDRVPIHSVPEYNAAAAATTGSRILLSICRDRRRSFAVITAR